MKPLDELVRRIVVTTTAVATPATDEKLPALPPGQLPELVPDLRELVDYLAGRHRYSDGSSEADFVLKRDPTFNPDAGRAAQQYRAARAYPASLATITEWLEALAVMVSNPPASDAKLRAYATVLQMACTFPLSVWKAALPEAVRIFRFWPAGEEVHALLRLYDNSQLADIAALEASRDATKPTPRHGPARASTVPYELPPPPPQVERRRPLRERGDDDFDPEEAKALDAEARKSRIDQLARLGDAGSTDLLAARRNALVEPREAKP
jgi:hypothetical protein